MTYKYPQFEWAPGVPILDDIDEDGNGLYPILNEDEETDEEEAFGDDNESNADDVIVTDESSDDDASITSDDDNNDDDLSSGSDSSNDDDHDNYIGLSHDNSPAVSDESILENDDGSHPSEDDAEDEVSLSPSPDSTNTNDSEAVESNTPDIPPDNSPTQSPTPAPSIALNIPCRSTTGRGIARLDVSSQGKYYSNTSPHLQFLQ